MMSDQLNIFTDKKLNIRKFKEGENATSYYHNMCQWFLNDMEFLLGGATRFYIYRPSEDDLYNPYDGKSFYVIHLFCDDALTNNFRHSCVNIHFELRTGEYLGNDIDFGKLRKGSPKLTIKERKSLISRIATERVKEFFDNGIQMGYLI